MSTLFIDTNILIHALDPRDPIKQQKASRTLLSAIPPQHTPTISTQVIQEFYNVATRKLQLPPAFVQREIQALNRMAIVTVTPQMIDQAIALSISDTLSFWDALIVTAALAAGSDQLWSEDLQTNRRLGSLTIINPLL